MLELLKGDRGRASEHPIFVSYSHRDAAVVESIVAVLKAARVKVFRDVDSIQPGKRWRGVIDEALRVAEIVLVFWCAHAADSCEVRAEFESAIELEKDIVPVLLDATPLVAPLAEYQWIDLQRFGHRVESSADTGRIGSNLGRDLVESPADTGLIGSNLGRDLDATLGTGDGKAAGIGERKAAEMASEIVDSLVTHHRIFD